MSTLIFGDNDYLNIQKENFLDFPLLAVFLSSGRDNRADFNEESSIERGKFNEEPRIDLLSEK